MTSRGYTRPLVPGDDTSADVAALLDLGVDEVIVESTHLKAVERPRLFEQLRAGDDVVVTSLERLDGRMDGLIQAIVHIANVGAGLRCPEMTEVEASGDTAAAIFKVLTEYTARPLTNEARRQHPSVTMGKRRGRPPVLAPDQIAMVKELRAAGRTGPHIARVLGVSSTTVYRALEAEARGGAPSA